MQKEAVLIGTLKSAPVLIYSKSDGDTVAIFTLIVESPYHGKASNRRKVGFIEVNVWRKKAELCVKYLNKNSCVAIKGRLQTRVNFEENKQTKQYYVIADGVRIFPNNKKEGIFEQDELASKAKYREWELAQVESYLDHCMEMEEHEFLEKLDKYIEGNKD